MALQKQSVDISFSQGLDTKSDPFRVSVGKFLSLQNSVFSKAGSLNKRNGYANLAALPDTTFRYLTTFNGNLTAVGNKIAAFSSGNDTWISKGTMQPVTLETLPAIRSNTNQSSGDVAVTSTGIACVVFTDQNPASLGASIYKYAIIDATTGQNLVAPTQFTATGAPKVFLMGNRFLVVYANGTNLLFIAINTATLAADAPVTISSTFTASCFDAYVANGQMYVAWHYSVGTLIKIVRIDSVLTIHTPVIFAGTASAISVTADISGATPIIWVSYYDGGGSLGYVAAFDQNLLPLLTATQIIAAGAFVAITAVAAANVLTVFYEALNAYTYNGALRSDYIVKNTVTLAGVVGTPATIARSVGLASKAAFIGTGIYFLTTYGSAFQPSYFLMDSSGNISLKLAYSNGGGYYAGAFLPNLVVNGQAATFAYLYKDLVEAVNADRAAPVPQPLFSQTGVNIATATLTGTGLNSAEIGHDLHFSGGFLWMYDGLQAVENNFFLFPDDMKVATATGAGSITAGTYYYYAVYEWSDNQGNIFRSAPSIPLTQVTTTASSTNTIDVPTLRLTYKITNPVKIVLYRASVAQPVAYKITSSSTPILNDPTVDYIIYVDTAADGDILGGQILYTTGGVVENIGPPPASALALFKSRLFLIDAEDKNLLWFSKQVIEATPVEMSDLFTIYVAPTISSEGSTGDMRALAALDDKLIIFKKDAIYYITGTGPDNTGANNDFSEPVFITSTVGSSNQNSIAFIPGGLMFQSDKGIWLLGRDLSTQYIGAPVEKYNGDTVLSAVTVPGTNQVRFTLDSGVTLMYDYYFQQWGTFNGIPSVSSTLYQGLHTFINSYGQALQEQENHYSDGANPVLMSFTSSWLNLAGLQGFERAYFFYLLGVYLSPHKLTFKIAYDYNSSPTQITTFTPDNYAGAYGSDTLYGGGSPYGGSGNIEQWRVFLDQQKCQAFQITMQESYDASYGVSPGAGISLSGINALVGLKDNKPRIRASRQIG